MSTATGPAMSDAVVIPEAPPIAGLRFRDFRGESDYPAMVEVFNRGQAADHNEKVTTVEETSNLYQHFPHFDPAQDLLLAEVEGRLVGYVRTTWREEYSGDRIFKQWAVLVPEWRRKGIGRFFLRHAERRLEGTAAGIPGRAACFFQAVISDTDGGALHLFSAEGYEPARYTFRMLRPTLGDLPNAPLPPGLEVRPVCPEDYRAIWEANVEAFRDHWGEYAKTEEDYARWREEPTIDPALWQVAWDGEQVAGMVLNLIHARENAEHHRRRAYTEDICVRKPWRRRGLARALILRSLEMLKQRGMDEAVLTVDVANTSGALRLYESLGYRPVVRLTVLRKPLVRF